MRELLLAGASVGARAAAGTTPLRAACEGKRDWNEETEADGHAESARLLIAAGANVDQIDVDCSTPLHAACRSGLTDCVRVLVQAGVMVDSLSDRKSPLFLACEHGHEECVQLLIDAGAALCVPSGYIPLFIACGEGHPRCVRKLVTAGAAVDVQAVNNHTALHEACEMDSIQCVELLIAGGANLDARDCAGDTPLHSAAQFGRLACAKLLLYAGARKDVANKSGHTPDLCPARVEDLASHRATISYIQSFVPRGRVLAAWRQAADAQRDAVLVFNAAAHGRPLELGKRLRLGKLAGGLERKGRVSSGQVVTPLLAAMLGGHQECMKVIEQTLLQWRSHTARAYCVQLRQFGKYRASIKQLKARMIK